MSLYLGVFNEKFTICYLKLLAIAAILVSNTSQ
jgi:hypothetical protein